MNALVHTSFFSLFLVNLTVILLVILVLVLFTRPILTKLIGQFFSRMVSDKYSQNLSELITSEKRISVLNTVELNLRAEAGEIIVRPLGSPKHFPGYDLLMFSSPVMSKLPFPESTRIDQQVTLGPQAAKPLTLQIPLLISGMAYGLALSENAKRALARAARVMQTAISSGEGPILPEEPQEAGKYILQISRWSWGGRTDDQIALADMLEVQMGQGAEMGAALAEPMYGKAQILAGLAPGERPIALPAPPGVQHPQDWPAFMSTLRQRAKGIPIALKLMATDKLEEDLSVAIQLGFDVVILDGTQGGSYGTATIKQDDFGIPTLNALVRADRFLKEQGVRETISLISSGGYFTPGACLKALALGADAINLGSLPLMALVHNQVAKVIPWEAPNSLVFYDSPATNKKLHIDQAATSVINLFTSMVLEMEEAMRGLGKTALKDLSPSDLVALDSYTAEVTGVQKIY